MIMTTDTITQRIHAKSDADLRKKLEDSIAWVWNETGYAGIRPTNEQVQEINHQLNGTSLPEFNEVPWIGSINKQFTEVAFAYLRDKYRNQAMSEFMQKVEAVSDILGQQL